MTHKLRETLTYTCWFVIKDKEHDEWPDEEEHLIRSEMFPGARVFVPLELEGEILPVHGCAQQAGSSPNAVT